MLPHSHQRRAFTIVELLVVISILSVLLTFILPALSQARTLALRTQCASNLRQCGIGLMAYQVDYRDWLPVFNWEPTQGNIPVPTLDANFAGYFKDDNIRMCPGFKSTLAAPSPLNIGIIPARLKTNLGFGYAPHGIDEISAAHTGGRRVSKNASGTILYLRSGPAGRGLDSTGTAWAYSSKNWDPFGVRPLMADAIGYERGTGRFVHPHTTDGGLAKRILPAYASDSIVIPNLMPILRDSGSNNLAWDGHVAWKKVTSNPLTDYRPIAVRDNPEGWAILSPSQFSFVYVIPAGNNSWR